MSAFDFKIEKVPLSSLRDHPRNYREHPDEQLDHLTQSIKQFGLYKNIVVSSDDVVLAGHGVVKALRKMDVDRVPVRRIEFTGDSPQALKILVADNEVGHLAEADDRELTDILKMLKDDADGGLLGTRYDEMMLANLLLTTRPASEIQDIDAANEWTGLPRMEDLPDEDRGIKIILWFRNKEDRRVCLHKLGLDVTDTTKSTWFPPRDREQLSDYKFESDADE